MASRPVGPVTMKFMVRDPTASSTPLADRAYTAIQDQLIMLDIPPHAAIVEGAWAEQLGVGRTPVREACSNASKWSAWSSHTPVVARSLLASTSRIWDISRRFARTSNRSPRGAPPS